MKMKNHYWPYEEWRKPRPVVKAIQAGVREFKRELKRQQRAKKLREQPDVF